MRPEGQPCASTTVTRTLLAASHAERFTTTSCWVTSWSCPRGRRILRQMSTLGRSGGPSRAQSGRTTGRRRFTGPSARPSSSRASESNTGCRISSSQKQLRPSRRKTWCWGTAGWWLPLQNTQKGWGKSTRPWQSPRFQRSCPQSASGKRNNVAQVRLSRQCTTPLYLSTHTLILFYISVQLLLLESHDNEFVFTVTFLIVIFFLLSSLRTQWLSLLLLLLFFFFPLSVFARGGDHWGDEGDRAGAGARLPARGRPRGGVLAAAGQRGRGRGAAAAGGRVRRGAGRGPAVRRLESRGREGLRRLRPGPAGLRGRVDQQRGEQRVPVHAADGDGRLQAGGDRGDEHPGPDVLPQGVHGGDEGAAPGADGPHLQHGRRWGHGQRHPALRGVRGDQARGDAAEQVAAGGAGHDGHRQHCPAHAVPRDGHHRAPHVRLRHQDRQVHDQRPGGDPGGGRLLPRAARQAGRPRRRGAEGDGGG
mmetsp:Transcript_10736/g.27539  ORF Transcript_10736/g.27539 Transcript_10736/m.27539 type:complete len:477 (+) Transcript_10736:261-1691(+)